MATHLGPISSGSLTVTAGGAITQSGVLAVTGAATIDAGASDITLGAGNQLNGVTTLNGSNITLQNIPALALGNVTATGNFAATVFGAVTQAAGAAVSVTGTTDIDAQSNDVTLTNQGNVFGGAVSVTGNTISVQQQSGQNLTINDISAYGDVLINAADGTLTFTGSALTITLRNGISDRKLTLVADQFVNQNTGAGSPIDLGSGTGNAWQFYLSHLDGNTFGSGSNTLSSGNQAIWGISYPTAIAQAGNRYIFATPQTLSLSPIPNSMTLTAIVGAGTTLPAAANDTNYLVSGFVNASHYGNAFTQDTAANVLDGYLTFTSPGSSASAEAGTYSIEMTAPTMSETGYSLLTNNPYGTIAVTASTPGGGTDEPDGGTDEPGGGTDGPGGGTDGPDVGTDGSDGSSIPDSVRATANTLNVNPAMAARAVEQNLPSSDGKSPISKTLTREQIEAMASGTNPNIDLNNE